MTGLGLDEFPKDIVDQIMATRGFAQPFIDAIVADLQDKPQVANSTWMMLIAEAHIPSLHPVSVETLAFNDLYEHARRPPMRVTVSDPSRLNDLCQYFRGVHAVACVEGETLTVHLAGAAGITDTRHLRAYLDTWLQLSAAAGRPLSAEVSDE